MFSESKVTEIYCLADDFCKEFAVQQEKYMIEDKSRPHRNKPNRMSDAEIMVILIFSSAIRMCFSPLPECAPRAVFENIIQIQCKNEEK